MKRKLQFSLAGLLLLTTVLSIGLTVLFAPRPIPDIVRSIHDGHYQGTLPPNEEVFESDTKRLSPLIAQLGEPVPRDLQQYLDHCIPISSRGTGTFGKFHNISDLLDNHTEAVPGCDVLPHGFFCLSGSDGNQFAFCVHDSRVYHLIPGSWGVGRKPSVQSIKQGALESWGSLREFLLHAEKEPTAFK